MRLIQTRTLLLSALSIAITFPAIAQTPVPADAWKSYLSKLDTQCADKHLNWYSPADLNDIVEDFTQHLTEDQQKTVKQFSDKACKNSEGGVTCGNTGFLQAAVQLGKIDDFVTRVCRVPMRCKAQSDCTNTN